MWGGRLGGGHLRGHVGGRARGEDARERREAIVDDLIDATSLERERFPEEQVTPYLATLVRQIYEDAERAFGKDKAKKGYRTAQQAVFKNDQSLFQSPDLAAKLPKG